MKIVVAVSLPTLVWAVAATGAASWSPPPASRSGGHQSWWTTPTAWFDGYNKEYP